MMVDGKGQTPVSGADRRPSLAIVANCMTPYRANLHTLIAAGIPELKLHTLITHAAGDFVWQFPIPESIHATYFGAVVDSPTASPLRFPLREWRKGGRLIEYLRLQDVRAVICMGYRYLSYLRVIEWCHRSGLPLFYRNDSNIRNERRLSRLKILGKRALYSWWMKRVSGVMSMGELGDQFFLQYGARRGRLYRVPYTPDYDAFAEVDPTALTRFRERYGLRLDRKYLLFSGRLIPMKRVDLLIDAFAAIAKSRPDWDLLIVGDGILRRELLSRVPQSLQQRVVWTGFLDQLQCALAYHAAEVLVLPSDLEPWALVVQEAMAAGRTVVASDVVGAAHELIIDQESGRLFPAGDLRALELAILSVTDESNLQRFQRHALTALSEWRVRVNPVPEVRRALSDVGVLNRDVPTGNSSAQRCDVSTSRKFSAPLGTTDSTS